MLKIISFRNIIGFSVFFIYFILTLILFTLFNNYYIKSTKEKYIDANINSTKSIEDYIKKEGENMLAYSRQVSVDQIVRVALNTGMLISIDYRVAEAVKIKPMAKFEYTKMAIQLKETKFGWAESSIEREIEIYDKDLKFISSSAKMKKVPSDRTNLEIVKGVHSGMGTEFWTNEITGDSFEIKGYSVVHRDAPLGVIVVKEKMDQIMIEDMKKMSGKELFLYKDNKIIISTLFEKDNKIENRDFIINNIEEKKYQELLINNRKAIFNFLPLKDNRGKILAYMAVGFYFDEIENMYKKNSISIFIVEFIFSLVLMILIYGLIMYLFKPFNTIINGIHKIGEGDYDFKVSAIAGKELVILSESVNNLSNEVSKREILLKEFNRILEDKNLKLEEMNKIKDSFLANTSHELRTPINGIIGLSESLMAGIAGDLNDKAKFNLDMIISSGRRLLHLINDILDFSKMNKKELTLEKNPLNIKNISESVGLMCHSLIGRKKIELINEIEDSFPLVEGDQNRLEQVFYNLIGNAIKFTDKGYVKISAMVKEDKAEICVEDTGIGISRDKFERIFVSFEQLEDSENRQYGGTGLGLSITRELVQIMGGEIYLESEEGVGSKFYFTLPISKEMFAVNKELKRESFQKSSVINNKDPQKKSDKNNYSELSEDTNRVFNVLIVDDEPINVQVLMNHLMMEKIQPDIAENGFEALEKIEQKNYDLILLDIMMPKMSGYEVARKLREKYTSFELPILILTAKNQIEDIVEGFEAGANDYLTKPFEQRELIARVFTLLELKKSLEIAEFNSRKYEMEKQKRVLAEKLREINNELTSTLFLEKVFEKLFDSIAEYVEYDRYYSLFKTYDGYEIFNHKGEFKTSFKNLKIFEENRMIKELKESKLPIFIKNIERSLIIEDEFEVKQVVGIPVMYRDELMGVIIFENMVEKEYNKSGLEIVFTIAGQAGIAIENARLFQKLIETFNKLKSIEEMVSVIYAEENRDIAVNYIIKTMTGKLGIKFNKAEYFEYDMLKHEIILKNEMFSVLNDDVERKIGRIKISQSKLLKKCVDSGDELFDKNDTIFDLPDDFRYKEEYTAILPVVYEHNVYGLLFIEAASDEDFMKVKNEKELLKIFSKNLSIYLENRKLEANGRKVDKLETFIKLSSAIVHEVKTPLVGIKGFAEMTKKKYLDDKKIQMYMDKIINETQRVDEMAVQLLEYAGNGTYIYNFKPTDLKMLIEKVVESKKGEILINSIRLVLDLEEIELECDEEQMIVAFNNILKNAIEASKGNDDMIKISTERKEGKVSIVFEDKGVGILKDISDKVFEPLITTKVQGTGLGLPIVMNIIKAHNGTVVLNSKEGEGTRVTVVLPRRVLR